MMMMTITPLTHLQRQRDSTQFNCPVESHRKCKSATRNLGSVVNSLRGIRDVHPVENGFCKLTVLYMYTDPSHVSVATLERSGIIGGYNTHADTAVRNRRHT